jgi:hypothetical protein
MNHLISINSNEIFSKDFDDLKKYTEIIFLIDKPTYHINNEGDILRSRKVKQMRFFVSEQNLDALIKNLIVIQKGIPAEKIAEP